MTKETRTYAATIEFRADGDSESAKIRGHAAIFDTLSDEIFGFREKIAHGAFDNALESSDIRALFNHDPNFVLGRTKSGTLDVSVDKTGLAVEIDAPNTQTIRDLVIGPMERGDVSQMSFGFTVAENGETWEQVNGQTVRTITEFSELFDVSPVTFPAYPDTDVAFRHMPKELREKMNYEKRGAALSAVLDEAINDMVNADEDLGRGDVMEMMGDAAGISANTVQNIISGDIICPPLQRLEGFADALNIPLSRLVSAARRDGCMVDEESGRTVCRTDLEKRLQLLETGS